MRAETASRGQDTRETAPGDDYTSLISECRRFDHPNAKEAIGPQSCAEGRIKLIRGNSRGSYTYEALRPQGLRSRNTRTVRYRTKSDCKQSQQHRNQAPMTDTTNRPIAECWATSNQAPLWVAIALYAVAQADPATGRATLTRGQLRAAIAPGSSAVVVSKAIRRAIRAGWLGEGSTALLLVVHHGA